MLKNKNWPPTLSFQLPFGTSASASVLKGRSALKGRSVPAEAAHPAAPSFFKKPRWPQSASKSQPEPVLEPTSVEEIE